METIETLKNQITEYKNQLEKIDNIFQDLSCPITQQIFYQPMIASDGHIYEKTMIEEEFRHRTKSPLTGLQIDTTLHKVPLIKNIIDDYLSIRTHLQKDRFIPFTETIEEIKKYPPHLITYNSEKMLTLLEQLYQCRARDRILFFNKTLIYFPICNHFINLFDANHTFKFGKKTFNLIHLVTKYGCSTSIRFLLERGANMNCSNEVGIYPIHNIVYRGKIDILEYLDHNNISVDYNVKNCYGETPLHAVIVTNNIAIIDKLLVKVFDRNVKNNLDMSSFQIACRCSNVATIEHLLDLGFDTQSISNKRYTSIDFMKSNPRLSKKDINKIKKKMDLSLWKRFRMFFSKEKIYSLNNIDGSDHCISLYI